MSQTAVAIDAAQKRTIPILTILPGGVRKTLSGKPVTSDRMSHVSLPPVVRRVAKVQKRIPVADWAATHRYVTDGAHVGQWRKEYAPHTVKIMDSFGQPWVREIWFCGVDQSGKTMTLNNCLAWSSDNLAGDIFYLMPSEETAKNIVDQKLRPMFEASPRLKGLLSARKDDTAITRIRLRTGKVIRPSWAGSPVAMATWSAQCCFGDEVDKYPEQVGKEADPITLIRKRARTFRGRSKMFFCSTPGKARLVRSGVEACQQAWENRVRCPHCDELIQMDGEHLIIPEGATVAQIERDGVEYACNNCGSIIDEQDRLDGIRSGGWVVAKGADVERPARVGFVHRAWECLDVSLKEIAVAWLKKEAGKLTDKIAWANGVEADDYEHVQQDRKVDYIMRLVDKNWPRGVVPRDTSSLLLLADTQRYGFFYQVWACGWGDDLGVTVIDRGFVTKFQHLKDLSEKTWKDPDDNEYRISAGWIDSGGGTDPNHPKHSRTQEVYVFCKKTPLFNPVKGRRNQAQPWNLTRLEYMPSRRTGKKVSIPGGLNLYTLNVTLFKGELATRLQVETGDPGGITLHSGIGEDYAAQMCAEYQDERGYWLCPNGKANHDWDISVYGLAAIDIMGIRNWKRPEEQQRIERPQPQQRRRRW